MSFLHSLLEVHALYFLSLLSDLSCKDPLLRLWDRDAFIRELLYTYQSFTTSSAVFDGLESKVGEFSGYTPSPAKCPRPFFTSFPLPRRPANPLTTAVCASVSHFLAQWVLADKALYHGEIFVTDDLMKARLSDFWNANRQYEGAFIELGQALFGAQYKYFHPFFFIEYYSQSLDNSFFL